MLTIMRAKGRFGEGGSDMGYIGAFCIEHPRPVGRHHQTRNRFRRYDWCARVFARSPRRLAVDCFQGVM